MFGVFLPSRMVASELFADLVAIRPWRARERAKRLFRLPRPYFRPFTDAERRFSSIVRAKARVASKPGHGAKSPTSVPVLPVTLAF